MTGALQEEQRQELHSEEIGGAFDERRDSEQAQPRANTEQEVPPESSQSQFPPRQRKQRSKPSIRRQPREPYGNDEHDEHRSIHASRFTLWETKTRFYLVSYNTAQTRFRILKVDRTPEGYHNDQQQATSTAPSGAAAPPRASATAAAASEPNADGKDSSSGRATTAPLPSKQSTTSLHQLPHTGGNTTPAPAKAESISGKSSTGGTAQNRAPPSTSAEFWTLGVTADQAVYDRSQITELLDMISEGNRTTGGLKEVGHFFGLIGFIRFTSTYYMVLISRRSVVALLGGHYIYHCDETKILPVCSPSFMASVPGRTKALEHEEARLLHTFKQVDLGKNFYFSYTYDLTRTLQENLTGCGSGQAHPRRAEDSAHTAWGYCEKFIWNHHLLLPAFGATERVNGNADDDPAHHSQDWVLPLCYGFVDQAKLSVMSRTVHVTLIARRSRHFAGARFLKRGSDEGGHVANDVETEQIVSEGLTTSFYAPGPAHREDEDGDSHDDDSNGEVNHDDAAHAPPLFSQNPRFTSYVTHRGSIPVFWTQDSTNMSPRPPIEISVVDPYFSAAACHFDDMLARYGSPVIILNLIKAQEKTPRESKLLNAFTECVHYLNQFLPPDRKMIYVAWDMSAASKNPNQDVIETLEEMAAEILEQTHFFHSGPEPTRFDFERQRSDTSDNDEGDSTSVHNRRRRRRKDILLQTGIARVNCVDCLDRTNAAQFVIGKAAFGHQLYAMGLIDEPYVGFDCDATDMLTEMYHDLGDTIALQYGGSHLVNTMETYRKINQWTSHSRDMLEGLKRYYANSFVDADKQAAIDLFLGMTRDVGELVTPGGVMPSSTASRVVAARKTRPPTERRSYRDWYTVDHLQAITPTPQRKEYLQRVIAEQSDFFWAEYYRPRLFTDLMRHHAFKMTAVHQHQPAALAAIGNGQGSAGAASTVPSHLPSSGASGIMSGFQLPSSPSKKSLTYQQKERLRRESLTSLAPSSPGSPTWGKLAMNAARARTDSFGSSTHPPLPLQQHSSSSGGSGGAGAGGAAASGSPTSAHRPMTSLDASYLVTSPFTSRVTHNRRRSHERRAARHQRHGSGESVASTSYSSVGSKYQPRLRTISGSSTSSVATAGAPIPPSPLASGTRPSTPTTMAKGDGITSLISLQQPDYTVSAYGTQVHEPARGVVRAASNPVSSSSPAMKAEDAHASRDEHESRALIGGVRRWMTLNHAHGTTAARSGAAGSASSSPSPATTPRPRTTSVDSSAGGVAGQAQRSLPSKRSNWLGRRSLSPTTSGSTSTAATSLESDASTKLNPAAAAAAAVGSKSTTSTCTIGGWTNPFPVQSAANPAPRVTAESLLTNWKQPTVSVEEGQEYASWVNQFAGNIKLESTLPEYDALLAASDRDGGVVSGDGRAADATDAIIKLDATHSLSPADLKLYIESVKRATRSKMDGGTGVAAAAAPAASTSVTGDGASSIMGSGVPGAAGAVDPAVALYTNLVASYAFQAGNKGVPEAKLRSYRTWLNVGLAGR